jgi:hypothetical protein
MSSGVTLQYLRSPDHKLRCDPSDPELSCAASDHKAWCGVRLCYLLWHHCFVSALVASKTFLV